MRKIKRLEQEVKDLWLCNKLRVDDVTKLWKVLQEIKEDLKLIKKEKEGVK